jgi:polysaccharide biosynthesis transport protein
MTGDKVVRFSDLWRMLVRNRWVVAVSLALSLALGLLVTSLQEPVFESEATLRVSIGQGTGNPLAQLGPSIATMGVLGGGGSGAIDTELLVLQSRAIAEAVVDSLGLQLQLVEPRSPRSEIFAVARVSRDAEPATYRLDRLPDGDYSLSRDGAGDRNPATRVAVGERIEVPGLVFSLHPQMRRAGPARIRFAVDDFRSAVEGARGRLSARQPMPNTEIVTLRFRSSDPQEAATVANVVASTFIQYRTRSSKTESKSTVDFLNEQVVAYERQLASAEARLQAFREQAQVVSLRNEAEEQVRRLAMLQAQRDELMAERETLARLVAQARGDGSGDEALQRARYRQLATYPVFLANGAIQNILQSLTQLENQRAELAVRRTATNVDVQGIDSRIRDLEMQLFQTATSYLQSLDNQITSLNARLATFETQLEQVPAREIEFARLARQQKLIEDIYTQLQARLKEAELQEAILPGDVRIVDPALVPRRPVAPRPLLNLALSGIFGVLLGLGLIVARESLDTTIRDPEDMRELGHSLPVLGVIPRTLSGTGPERFVRRLKIGSRNDGRLDHPGATLRPRGRTAEAYRRLEGALTLFSGDERPRVVTVLSATDKEGRAALVANLGAVLADEGLRVLVLDCDPEGTLHRALGRELRSGRAVGGGAGPVQVIQIAEGSALHLAGSSAAGTGPRLTEAGLACALETLRAEYDLILINLPAIHRDPAAAMLGRVADASLLVVRAGATQTEDLERLIPQMLRIQVPLLGVVLTEVDRPAPHLLMYAVGTAAPENGRPVPALRP